MSSSDYLLFARCVPSGECLKCPFRGRSIAYGPFRSRRRGMSVGINLFPGRKVCSFNCVYCFRGRTEVKTLEPTEGPYEVSAEILRKALREALKEVGEINAVDFSGSGEPTLHPRFKEFTEVVREFTRELGLDVSVGIFTNSSTLGREDVVEALRKLDFVEAKLDTAIQWKFRVINRPYSTLQISDIVGNLARFRRVFEGTLAVQVMLLRYHRVGNYLVRDAELLADALSSIEPDAVHIYTVYRTPRLSRVVRADESDMLKYARVLERRGFRVEVFTR
ncbi:MAG: radical SAM protein [Desulfurococcales archaeon]|nr:radical SAM protein [Desulfurococcales archaeon]